MSTSKDFINYIEEKLGNIPTFRTRSMFGEYAAYLHDKPIAFICDDTMFLKITPNTTKLIGNEVEQGPCYPGSKDYYIIEERMLEDASFMANLLEQCSQDVPAKKPKKAKSPR